MRYKVRIKENHGNNIMWLFRYGTYLDGVTLETSVN